MVIENEQRLDGWRRRTDGLMLAVGVGSFAVPALELIQPLTGCDQQWEQ